MEVGSLSVPVRADLGPITQDLERLRRQLGQAETQTQGVTQGMQQVQRQTRGLTSALGPLATALAGVFSVRALIQFTDTWTDLTSRVNLAAGSIERGGAVIEQLQVIARRTYSSLEQTTEAYIRNAQTLRDLGRSTQETLDYTEALNNALVVSGARADRAASVQDALGKALALGTLRGDNLNTVIERGGRVAELLAEELGTTVSGLRQFGTDGKITGDVIDRALVGNLVKLREEAESMPATIGDAFQLLSNALLQTIGIFDSANEISGTFAEGLITIADNMQRLLTYVATGTAGWVAYRVAVLAVNSGLFTTVGALAAVRIALQRLLISSGIGILVVAVGELVNQLIDARRVTESWGEAFKIVGQRVVLVLDGLKFAFFAAVESMQAAWYDFMGFVLRSANDTFGPILRLLGMSAEGVSTTLDGLARSASNMWEIAGDSASIAAEQFRKAFAELEGGEGADLSGDGGTSRVVPTDTGGGKLAKAARDAERLAESYRNLIADGQAFIAQQGIEQQAIGMTELEAAKLRATFDLLNQAQRAGIELTPQQTAELTRLAEAMAEAEHETRRLQERYNFAKDTFKGFFTDLKTELQNGASIWEAFGTAAANALQKIADKALDLALNGIFDLIFGAFGGGGFFGGPRVSFGGGPGLFENGTSYAPGGMAIVGERGPELVKLPGGSQVFSNNRVMAPSQASFGGGSGGGGNTSRVALDVFVKDDGKIGAIARQEAGSVVDVAIHEYDAHTLPSSVERVRNQPRFR